MKLGRVHDEALLQGSTGLEQSATEFIYLWCCCFHPSKLQHTGLAPKQGAQQTHLVVVRECEPLAQKCHLTSTGTRPRD